MSNFRTVKNITGHNSIDGVVPGVKGQRAFPIRELRNFDPFVMLDHIGSQKVGAKYSMNGVAHPHRGFETITFMFDGIMDHVDSLGNKTRLSSGSVQRMNAGKGIIHGGNMMADPNNECFHEMQLWVNSPAKLKMSNPDIHNVSSEEIKYFKNGNVTARIIAGEISGIKGEINTFSKTKIAHLVATNEGNITLENITSNYNTLVYVMEGNVKIDNKIIKEYHSAELNNDGESIKLEFSGKAQVLVISGEPLNEPIAMGGPFVMNTQEEIEQAYADFEQGKFGTVN